MSMLLLEASLGDTMQQGLLVTVMGVCLVFLILAFLIAVITLLKHFNALMNRWDAYMLRVRAMRAEIKALKKTAREERANAIEALSDDLSKADKDKAMLDIKNEYCSKTIANKAAITEIHANFDAVSKIEKERRAAISAVKAEARKAIKTAKNGVKRNDPKFVADKLILLDEMNGKIASVNKEFDAKIVAVGVNEDASGVIDCDATDDEITAVIAAVIAYVTSQENSGEKKAKFRVRSLKEIKNY